MSAAGLIMDLAVSPPIARGGDEKIVTITLLRPDGSTVPLDMNVAMARQMKRGLGKAIRIARRAA